jgi:hypothetical protein
MNRRLFAVVIAGALAVAPAQLPAQLSVDIKGGASAPVSRLNDIANIGYDLSAGLNIGIPGLPVGVRLEGAYDLFGLRATNDNVRIINGTANAIISLGLTRDAPYVIAGLGAYNRSFTPNSVFGAGRTVIGVNGGGGLRLPLIGFTAFFEARYHVMLGSNIDQTDYQFVPITFGVIF